MNYMKTYVPIMLSDIDVHNRDRYLTILRKMQVPGIYLSLEQLFEYDDDTIAKLSDMIQYFESNGVSCSVWIMTLGFGIPLDEAERKIAKRHRLTRIKGLAGTVCDAFCPMDKEFLRLYTDKIKRIAGCGARTILLDDDFCLSIRPNYGCNCHRHGKALRRATHLPLSAGMITLLSVYGSNIGLRAKWMNVMGKSLSDFAMVIRAAVDEVDPSIRIGVCAGYTSWDWEGVDTLTISRILAGGNRPLLRLTGAPYWTYTRRFGTQDLITIIECARMQLDWTDDAEVLAENDSFPRPTYHCPAAYVESFHQIMRSVGRCDDLKYVFDYLAPPEYESRYYDAHIANLGLYDRLEQIFAGKSEYGIRVFEKRTKAAFARHPVCGNPMEYDFFSRASTMLANAGLPTVYTDCDTPLVCFGINARALCPEDMSHGLILDFQSALYLQLTGVDVGLSEYSGLGISAYYRILAKAPCAVSNVELFNESQVKNSIFSNPTSGAIPFLTSVAKLYKIKPNENATILSTFADGSPTCYSYVNSDGIRCVVYAFDASSIAFDSDLLLSYHRAQQIRQCLGFLSDAPLPPHVEGNHSGLYLLCKRSSDRMAIGVWNMTTDERWNVPIAVAQHFDVIDNIGDVAVKDDDIIIPRLAPFSLVAVEITLKNC